MVGFSAEGLTQPKCQNYGVGQAGFSPGASVDQLLPGSFKLLAKFSSLLSQDGGSYVPPGCWSGITLSNSTQLSANLFLLTALLIRHVWTFYTKQFSSSLWTSMGCPTIILSSDTNYPAYTPTPQVKGSVSQDALTSHCSHQSRPRVILTIKMGGFPQLSLLRFNILLEEHRAQGNYSY